MALSLEDKIKALRAKREAEALAQQPKVSPIDVAKEVPGVLSRGIKNVGNFFTSNTRQFGNTAGSALALSGQQKMLEQESTQSYNMERRLLDAIRSNKQQGRDSTRLMEQYKRISGKMPTINELNPTINTTNKQVLGQAAGTLLEATAAAKLVKGAQTAKLSKGVLPTVISGGSKAITRGAAAVKAAKGVAVGASQGYAYDVASKLKENKATKDVFKPGIGTAIGAAIPAVIGTVGLTRTETQLQIRDLIEKGFNKKEATRIVTEGGYIRMLQNPKMQELGDKINELNSKMVSAPNKLLYDRYKKAYEEAVDYYKKESQAGFIKNPFNKDELPVEQLGKLVKKGKEKLSPQVGLGGQQAPLDQTKIPKDVSSFYNVDRLKINDSAKGAIKEEVEKAGELLQKTVGKKLSHNEVLDLASQTSKTLDDTITREQTKVKIAANLNLRREVAKAAMGGKVDKNFVNLWIKDKAAGEDIARQLEARKINADPKELKSIKAILDSIYRVNKNADEITKAAEGVDFNNADEVTSFYRKFIQPKAGEWIDALRYNAMLSSPTTHLVNTSSNFQGTGILAPIEKTVTGLVDATRAALNGKPRQYAVGEGVTYAKGYYSNISAATKRFQQVMRGAKTFDYSPDLPVTTQIGLSTGGFKRGIEKTLKFPTKLMEATDQFFSALTEGGLESSLAYRASKGIGSPDDIAQETAKRLFRGELHSADQGYLLSAIDDLTGKIDSLRHADNPITSTIAKFTMPFLRTPTNLLKQGIEYSPAGIVTLVGNKKKTEQLSKIIIGSASAAGAATLLGQDRLTWAEPVNAKQKAAFRAAGRQPYSVKIGDKWISYSKLHPAFAFNFALIASIDDALKNQRLPESDADSILQAFAKYGTFVADQSYLKNIGDFVGGLKGDVDRKTAYASNYVQQLIPFRALMSYVERLTDSKQRRVDPDGTTLEKQMQSIIAQIPWAAQEDLYIGNTRVSPLVRTNQFGAAISNQNRLLNAVSPARVTTVNKPYEGLYKLDESKKKLDRFKTDIDVKIKKLREQRIRELQSQ